MIIITAKPIEMKHVLSCLLLKEIVYGGNHHRSVVSILFWMLFWVQCYTLFMLIYVSGTPGFQFGIFESNRNKKRPTIVNSPEILRGKPSFDYYYPHLTAIRTKELVYQKP